MTNRDEILALAGEPFAYGTDDLDGEGSKGVSFDPLSGGTPLYTADQVLAGCENLEQEVERLTAEADPEALHIAYLHGQADRNQTIVELRQQLAAAQAQIQQYREAIVKAGIAWSIGEPYSRSYFEQALALPADTSALEAIVKQAGEVMRERCAAESLNYHKYDATEAIRDLPALTLADLKCPPASSS